MDNVLALDIGTQSLRACVVDRDLNPLEREQISYSPEVKSRNRVEIDAEVLWDAFINACSHLKYIGEVEAISFSTLCPSLLPIDANGKPLGPIILHMDRRSYRQATWALNRVGKDKFLRIAGNLPIPGGISCTSLLWYKENEPSIYHRKDVVFGHAITLFMRRLVGRYLIDPSHASLTGLYDTVGYGDWADELLDDMEINREKLAEVALSTTVVGNLDRKVAAKTGLPPEIPVVMGANDATCSAVGAGVTEPGMLMNISGTVDMMALCLDRPMPGENHLLRTHAYRNRWLAMRMVGAGGAAVEWFRNTFCQDMSRETFYDEYLRQALSSARPPETRFQPYLTGDRQRIKMKTGSFTRLTLNTTREDCLLALAHGIFTFQAESLREWGKRAAMDRRIYHIGGGAKDAYTQYKQRVLKDFEFVQPGETAFQGAARLAFGAVKDK
jgi:sugar (pentulose or hexulose) kinase